MHQQNMILCTPFLCLKRWSKLSVLLASFFFFFKFTFELMAAAVGL